jgi:acyl-CoA oxidase
MGFRAIRGCLGLQTEVAPTATYEGENTVLLLQTARFLSKQLNNMKKGKVLGEAVSFLEQASKLSTLNIPVDTAK